MAGNPAVFMVALALAWGFAVSAPAQDSEAARIAQLKKNAVEAYDRAFQTRFLNSTLNEEASAALRHLSSAVPESHPDRPALSNLDVILVTCMEKQPTYSEMNWMHVEQSAIVLRYFRFAGGLADSLIEWVRLERTAKNNWVDGRDYRRADRYDEAFRACKKVDPSSVYFKRAEELMQELTRILRDCTVREVCQRIRGGDYSLALERVNWLLTLLEGRDPQIVAEFESHRKECEKNLDYVRVLAEAEDLAVAARWNEMEEKLCAIDPGAPAGILSRMKGLRDQLEEGRGRITAAALDRYAAALTWATHAARKALEDGNAEGAAKILEDVLLQDLLEMREKVKSGK